MTENVMNPPFAAPTTAPTSTPPSTVDVNVEGAPVAEGEATPRKKQVRNQVKYPGLKDAAGNPVLLKEIPADFDASKHKPFVRKDFEDETIWLLWRAELLEKKAATYRDEAKMIRELGSPDDRKKATQLLKMRTKFEDLKNELAGSGIDVDAILAKLLGGDSDAPATAE